MKLRTVLVIDAVIKVLLALGLLLGPATLLKFFGLTGGKTEVLLAQVFGSALVGYAVLCWTAKDFADPQAARAATSSLLAFSAIGFIVTFLGVLSQVTRAGAAWLVVVLFLVFAAAYGYFEFAGPRE